MKLKETLFSKVTSEWRRVGVKKIKDARPHLTEEQIDKILKDTFPASDPPSWY